MQNNTEIVEMCKDYAEEIKLNEKALKDKTITVVEFIKTNNELLDKYNNIAKEIFKKQKSNI